MDYLALFGIKNTGKSSPVLETVDSAAPAVVTEPKSEDEVDTTIAPF